MMAGKIIPLEFYVCCLQDEERLPMAVRLTQDQLFYFVAVFQRKTVCPVELRCIR